MGYDISMNTLGYLTPEQFEVFESLAKNYFEGVTLTLEYGGVVQLSLDDISMYDFVAWFFDGFKQGLDYEVRNPS